jgi:ADP-ribosyl-[dinitrogen reductase] hydrolase
MTSSNSSLFAEMLSSADLPVRHGQLFSTQPRRGPRTWDRVEGMLLGLAIGDALGNTSEGQTPLQRENAHGEVRNFLRNRNTGNERRGTPSDDSQLAFWTVEHLVEHGALDVDVLGRSFASRRIFGVGHAMLDFVSSIRRGEEWRRAATKSAGNGALMRIAPVVLPHLTDPTAALWQDTALLARLTHNDCASVASCIAFVSLLWDLAALERPPSADWWAETFISALRDLDRGDEYTPRGGAYSATGAFSDLVETRLMDARRAGWSTRTACERFQSGAYLLETVPCALYILTQHGADAEEAIVRAVNDTRDNDTTAAIVGAAVGMLHGVDALPRRWREGLTGRTTTDDDGRMFELIERAKSRFWPS